MILSYPSGASFINTAGTLYIKAARCFVIPVSFLSFVAVFATLSNNVQDCTCILISVKCTEIERTCVEEILRAKYLRKLPVMNILYTNKKFIFALFYAPFCEYRKRTLFVFFVSQKGIINKVNYNCQLYLLSLIGSSVYAFTNFLVNVSS